MERTSVHLADNHDIMFNVTDRQRLQFYTWRLARLRRRLEEDSCSSPSSETSDLPEDSPEPHDGAVGNVERDDSDGHVVGDDHDPPHDVGADEAGDHEHEDPPASSDDAIDDDDVDAARDSRASSRASTSSTEAEDFSHLNINDSTESSDPSIARPGPGSPDNPGSSSSSSSTSSSDTSDVDDAEGLDQVERALITVQARHGVSQRALQELIDVFRNNLEVSFGAMRDGRLKSYRWIRRKHVRDLPSVYVTCVCFREDDDDPSECVRIDAEDHFPKKVLMERGLTLDSLIYRLRLSDVMDVHRHLHDGAFDFGEVDLALDGVPASRSGLHSFDFLSVQFVGCRSIYLVGVFEPFRKRAGRNIEDELLSSFLQDLNENGLQLRYFIADAPKRSKVQGLVHHKGNYSCNLCTAKKTAGNYTLDSLDWPLRTLQSLDAAVEAIEEDGCTDDEVLLGVRTRSALRDVDNFNLLDQVIVEGMHLIYLGVLKRMLQMSYLQGARRTGRVTFRRVHSGRLDQVLLSAKGLTQFVRRLRVLDFAVWKALEYRNLVICFWPAIMLTCPEATLELWLKTVYIVRSLLLPDVYFAPLENALKDRLRDWFTSYQDTFGTTNMTYNTHMFQHSDLVRRHGPLTATSAVRFEDSYGDLKTCYKPGTPSMGIQMMKNSLIKVQWEHKCKKTHYLGRKVTSKVDDRFVYTSAGQVVELDEQEHDEWPKTGVVIDVEDNFEAVAGYNFNEVLVYSVKEDQGETPIEIQSSREVAGKCVKMCNVISVVTWNILCE